MPVPILAVLIENLFPGVRMWMIGEIYPMSRGLQFSKQSQPEFLPASFHFDCRLRPYCDCRHTSFPLPKSKRPKATRVPSRFERGNSWKRALVACTHRRKGRKIGKSRNFGSKRPNFRPYLSGMPRVLIRDSSVWRGTFRNFAAARSVSVLLRTLIITARSKSFTKHLKPLSNSPSEMP